MEDKTIIDGINVKDCAFLHSEICCDIDDEFCFKDNNCYFKQLARAKEECFTLKVCYQAALLQRNEAEKKLDKIKELCNSNLTEGAVLDDILEVINENEDE